MLLIFMPSFMNMLIYLKGKQPERNFKYVPEILQSKGSNPVIFPLKTTEPIFLMQKDQGGLQST